ncbi:MAG: NADH-quinone oxidoreductase subunit C [Candidatus Methanofastidiosia archaeon]
MSKVRDLVDALKEELWNDIYETEINAGEQAFIKIKSKKIRLAVKFISQFDSYLCTISTADIGTNFEVLYHFQVKKCILTLRCPVSKDVPIIDSISDIIPGATQYEREGNEMMGIDFEGNPDKRKLFIPENYPGKEHILRRE